MAEGEISCVRKLRDESPRMTIQEYLEKAAHCDRMAADAKHLDVKLTYADLARQWRDIARQASHLQRQQG